MMASGLDIVIEARKWIGTPFAHQGRLLGVGADCAGLVLGVGKALELVDYDAAPVYGRKPSGNELQALCDEYLDRCAIDDIRAGRILMFAFDFAGEPQHIGIANATDGVIHVYAQVRRAVEHRLGEAWMHRLRAVYRFRGLSDG